MKYHPGKTLLVALAAICIGIVASAPLHAQKEAENCNNLGCGCGYPGPLNSKGFGPCGCFGQNFDYGCGCGKDANLGCGCGNPGPSAYKCKKCLDNSSCLGCDGVPFSGKRNLGCGCGQPSPSDYKCGKCGDNTSCLDCLGVPNGSAKDNGCGCNQPGRVCGRCGGQRTVCGDCSTTCCPATYGNNPDFKCITYVWRERSRNGATTSVGAGPWHGYFENKEPHCTRPNENYVCANIRCKGGACPAGNLGCFDPKATILLQEGVFKSADEVKAGDMIYNPLTGRSAAVKRVITGPEEIPMIEMGYEGNLLRVTQDHPVLTKGGIKRARDIQVGDVILDASGNEQPLAYVRAGELLDGQIAVNFELDVSSSDPLERVIVADNIASGDLAVQNSTLPGEE